MSHELWTDPLKGEDVLSKPHKEIVSELDALNAFLAKNTLGTIVKAWGQGGLIDSSGEVWLDAKFLPAALRTNTLVAKMHKAGAKERDRVSFQGRVYLSGAYIHYLLNNVIIRSVGKRRAYARISEELYIEIRESNKARERQMVFIDHMSDTRKGLKKKRLKEYNVSLDELTGDCLVTNSAEFSHILSASKYFCYSDKVWNGLVLNKDTHDTLTREQITDDRELLSFCKSRKWDTSWHNDFSKRLKVASAA